MSKPTLSDRSVRLGVYADGAPWNMAALDDFEALAERSVDIVMWYQDWARTQQFDPALFEAVLRRGSTPLITWEPWDHLGSPHQPHFHLGRIVAGECDDHVRSWARGLARLGEPVLLRWAHEMNGNWSPWGLGVDGTTARHYRDAWARLWRLFQEERAVNVQWVWSPNILEGAAAFEPLYPGDEFVDWVGLDGYNWGGWRWRSFRRLFAESYLRLTSLTSRPLMIAETACAEGLRKPRWIREGLERDLAERFPRVVALVWFHARKERDWRIDSSPESGRAFAAAVHSRMYSTDTAVEL